MSSSSRSIQSTHSSSATHASLAAAQSIYPVLVKHPRCRPFFRIGDYGIVVARVQASTIRFYDRDDIEGLSLDAMPIHLRACDNLRLLLDRGEIQIRLMHTPAGNAFFAIEHQLASSCLLLAGVREKARGAFGFQRLVAAVFRRTTLVVFADPGGRARDSMARAIGRSLLQGQDVSDADLFWLDEADPRPIHALPPPPAHAAIAPRYFAGTARTLVLPRAEQRSASGLFERERNSNYDGGGHKAADDEQETPTVRAISSISSFDR